MNDKDNLEIGMSQENDDSKGKRSILKMGFSQPILPGNASAWNHDQTEPIAQTFSQPEILSHSNNTTSKLSVAGPHSAKVNRRVSFAPDVTLHRFESVPQRDLNKYDAITNDTSIMEFTQPIPIHNLNKDTDLSNEMDESLDMTEIHNKDDSMNEAEESMELTMRQEQLTPIMVAMDPVKDDIPKVNLNTRKNSQTQDSEDNSEIGEEPMELTEVVNFNDHTDLSQLDKSTTEDDSIANYTGTQGSQPMDLTQISSGTSSKVTESQPMDFTQIQNSKNNENIESQQMEFTQITKANTKQPEINTNRKTMPSALSKLPSTLDGDLNSSNEKNLQGGQITTPLHTTPYSNVDDNIDIAKESHVSQQTSESRIPPPSSIPRIIRKRKNLEDPITPVINVQDVSAKKRPHTENTESNIEEMEKMSPIKIPEFNETEKQTTNKISDYSLKEFIKDTDVGFLTDINILRQDVKSIAFPLITQTEDSIFKAQSLYNALYNDIPMVQMNTFIIKELLSISSQSSKSFENLDKQIMDSSNPPLLLLDYFNSDDKTKEKMKEQLQLIKYFAKLHAKKSFNEWYLSQLKNLKSVLIENETFLEQEYQKIKSSLEDIKLIHVNVGNIKKLLKAELQAIETSSKTDQIGEYSLSQKIRLTWLKQELQKNKLSIEQYPKLCEQEKTLANLIIENQTKLKNLKAQITSKTDGIIDGKEIEPQLNESQNMLYALENLTGIKVASFKNSTLSLKFQDIPNGMITVNLDAKEKNVFVIDSKVRSNKLLPFVTDLLLKENESTTNLKTLDKICHIIINLRKMTKVFQEFEYLDSLFLTKITKDGIIQFFDYNTSFNDEIKFEIHVGAFVEVVMSNNSKVTLTAHTVKGDGLEVPDIMARLTSKTNKILPWFNEDRINIIVK
ncbi:similar to Saccharomyces cerevisiae YGL093W SPC105 Subunit of a kinetochore-microtubule binding complex with Kre28p that bridges centromeric heterochromatin and kinetochore MAPs and motors [Maudiozyma saulgeensis]|uniref:Similar to Saccharomyces cerevisiae YGL093W SPC105 Subunit of a kinetochore-microtubule binding complex with Kre28p that bridges centromeric heterochromatin and kinetochore MAPs and motors n=1 Tax=Maudiozyma saulgeensis TaxID=1789683 RepID=A0A1X7R0J6_9SACH|nr:similar to Saccharomyces cerevisiae YGL093W SPC105 Subunit of a kinetochore-microtubule binding complex with Kre28p that bridges centromeric heterochromatin and kinetochore MAPs and motors [Kazachstania saulgeensis]